jgi:hypothetical protein
MLYKYIVAASDQGIYGDGPQISDLPLGRQVTQIDLRRSCNFIKQSNHFLRSDSSERVAIFEISDYIADIVSSLC